MHTHRHYILKVKSDSFIYLFNCLTSIPAATTMPWQFETTGDDREQATMVFALTEKLTSDGKGGPIRDGGGRSYQN